MAKLMLSRLPFIDAVVTHLPTDPSRIRQRGFDHAALLAKKLAIAKKLPQSSLLSRKKGVQQVGSSKAKRKQQLKGIFEVRNRKAMLGKTILVVDDIMTTGASMEEAARTLKQAGAKKVYGVVFARVL